MNFLESPVVPFRIGLTTQAHQAGITRIAGLMRYEERKIILEYRITDNKMKITEPRTLEIDIADIRELVLKKGIFRTKLQLKTRRLAVFKDFPFITGDKMLVWAWKREHHQMEHLASQIRMDRSEDLWE